VDKGGSSWLANVQVNVAFGGGTAAYSYIDATFIDLSKPESTRVIISMMDTETGTFDPGEYWYDLDGSEI